jgi:hypothetical protein
VGIPRDHVRKTSRNAAAVLDLVIRLSGEPDSMVGRAVGLSRPMIKYKKTTAGWYMDDAVVFGEAFDVPPSLFFMDPDEAHHWLLDNGRAKPVLRPVSWAIEEAYRSGGNGSANGRKFACLTRTPRSPGRNRPVNYPPPPRNRKDKPKGES